MITSHRYVAAGLLAMGLWISAPACASGNYGRYRSGGVYRDLDRRAYDNGFRSGVSHGEDDARDRRDFRVDRDGDYRSADDGYRRRDGYDRDDYRRAFRQGYEAGYARGYNRFARGYEGRNRRSRPPVVVGPRGGVVAVPRGGYGYNSPAAQNGFRDGLDAGRKDANDRKRFDPIGAKRYRQGDHDYNGRYGSRDDYKRDYRAAFQQGYEQGYRDYRR